MASNSLGLQLRDTTAPQLFSARTNLCHCTIWSRWVVCLWKSGMSRAQQMLTALRPEMAMRLHSRLCTYWACHGSCCVGPLELDPLQQHQAQQSSLSPPATQVSAQRASHVMSADPRQCPCETHASPPLLVHLDPRPTARAPPAPHPTAGAHLPQNWLQAAHGPNLGRPMHGAHPCARSALQVALVAQVLPPPQLLPGTALTAPHQPTREWASSARPACRGG